MSRFSILRYMPFLHSARRPRVLPSPRPPRWCVEALEERTVPALLTFSSSDVPLRIPASGTNGSIVSRITINEDIFIGDLNVQLDIQHTSVEELDVFLRGPDGTRVELFTDVGGDLDDFTNTLLDDEASTAITSGAAPFAGTFRPEGNLRHFDSRLARGTWTLEITDDAGGDSGFLKNWSLLVMPEEDPGSIQGSVFDDRNTNGQRDGGEGGLANQTVFLDANSNGILDGEVFTSTDAQGFYHFANVPQGNHRIVVIPPVDTKLLPSTTQVVNVGPSETVQGIDFGVVGLPDLEAEFFSLDRTSGLWGDTLTGTYRIRNRGLVAAGPFSVEIVLSNNPHLDANDTVLPVLGQPMGNMMFSSLAAGATVEGTFTVALPGTPLTPPLGFVEPDTVFVGLMLDSKNAVEESNELNNGFQQEGRDRQTFQVLALRDESEPNDTLAMADPLLLGAQIRGEFSSPQDHDVYAFSIPENGRFLARWVGDATASGALRLLSEDGRVLMTASPDQEGITTLTTHLAPGNYFLETFARNPQLGAYHLETQFTAATVPLDSNTVGNFPSTLNLADVNGDGQLDLITANCDSDDVSVLLGQGNGIFANQQRFTVGDFPSSLSLSDVNGDGAPDIITANASSNEVSVLLGQGDGYFANQQRFSVGDTPSFLSLADVNGDSRLDIITANRGSDDVSVLLGQGDGSFLAQQRFFVGGSLYNDLSLADLNVDGHLDIIIPDGFGVSVLPGNGDGSFASLQRLAPRSYASNLSIEDIDGDGNVDIVTFSRQRGLISLALNQGNGSFISLHPFSVGAFPNALLLSDINGDSILDIITANRNSNDVSVVLGQGNATFGPHLRFAVGENPTALSLADLNGDGRLDIITANSNSLDVSVLLSQGDGTFIPQVRFDLGASLTSLTLFDLNEDGKLDIIATTFNNDQVSVLFGQGDGSFVTQLRFGLGRNPESLLVSDLNVDGRLDIITTNFRSDDLSVVLGQGNGSLALQQKFIVGDGPGAMALADLNGDGRLDIVAANRSGFEDGDDDVSVLLGLGDGSFANQQRFDVGDYPFSLKIVDINGDRTLDIVTANGTSNNVSVLLGNGDGSFATQHRFAVGFNPNSLNLSDINGDGEFDIITTNSTSDDVSVLLGQGDGSFANQQRFNVGNSPASLSMADINGDGHLDILISHLFQFEVSVLLGQGDGSFSPQIRFDVGYYPNSLSLADFNGDGWLDFITTNGRSDDVSVLLGQGNGSFDVQQRFSVGDYPRSLRLADVNGDGRLDIITANRISNDVSVLLGQGDGSFANQQVFAVGNSPGSISLTDINGDGRLDIITANRDSDDVSVLLGQGDGNFQSAIDLASSPLQGDPVLGDITGDGRIDAVTVNIQGQVLLRRGLDALGTDFDVPIVLNTNQPLARTATIVDGKVAVVNQNGSVSVYRVDANGNPLGVQNLLAGSSPTKIVSGNIDGLHGRDLIVTNTLSNDVSVFLAHADGTFAALPRLFVGDGPSDVQVVDLDGGTDEILVSNSTSADVTVVRRRADGTFEIDRYRADRNLFQVENSFSGSRVRSFAITGGLAVGDFRENGAGVLDVVAVNSNARNLQFLEGTTHGGLLLPKVNDALLLFDVEPAQVRVGNFNNDNYLDLALVNKNSTQIWILLGDGDGHFTRATTMNTQGQVVPFAVELGIEPSGLTVRDANGDGIDDLFATNEFGDILLLLAKGDGTFESFARLDGQIPLAVQDLNGDGVNDVVLANKALDRLVVQIGTQDGQFTPELLQERSDGLDAPAAVLLQDVNGDGFADLVVANSAGFEIKVFLGLANGQFDTTNPIVRFSGNGPTGVTLDDLDDDGDLDIAVANQGSNRVTTFLASGTGAAWTLDNGRQFETGGDGPTSVEVARGADGKVTGLTVTNSVSGTLGFLPSTGQGFFNDTNPQTINIGAGLGAGTFGNFGLGVAGQRDRALLTSAGVVLVTDFDSLFNASNPNDRLRFLGGGNFGAIVAGDLSRDGIDELVVTDRDAGVLLILDADGELLASLADPNLENPSAMALLVGDDNQLYVTDEGEEDVTVFQFKFEDLMRRPQGEVTSNETAGLSLATTLVADSSLFLTISALAAIFTESAFVLEVSTLTSNSETADRLREVAGAFQPLAAIFERVSGELVGIYREVFSWVDRHLVPEIPLSNNTWQPLWEIAVGVSPLVSPLLGSLQPLFLWNWGFQATPTPSPNSTAPTPETGSDGASTREPPVWWRRTNPWHALIATPQSFRFAAAAFPETYGDPPLDPVDTVSPMQEFESPLPNRETLYSPVLPLMDVEIAPIWPVSPTPWDNRKQIEAIDAVLADWVASKYPAIPPKTHEEILPNSSSGSWPLPGVVATLGGLLFHGFHQRPHQDRKAPLRCRANKEFGYDQ